MLAFGSEAASVCAQVDGAKFLQLPMRDNMTVEGGAAPIHYSWIEVAASWYSWM